jgi:hypothetical protein
MDVTTAGIIAAISMIFLFFKMDMKKVCGYDFMFDISFTFLLAYMFSGTYSGMFAALLGGAILSVFLWVYKKLYGYKKLRREGFKFFWEEYLP